MLESQIIPLPKIIILDINMPKMNGIEFLKIMRENERLKNISVFVMTTSNEDSDKINAYNLNVAGYILKPLSFEKFLTSVATLKNFWQLCEL
jgi:CheY-like chemotaxis protein